LEKFKDYESQGVQFKFIDYVFEIFPAPLPSQIDMDGDLKTIEDANDFFSSSIQFEFEKLHFIKNKIITAKSNGQYLEVSSIDFV
jgi:hypothetical protein